MYNGNTRVPCLFFSVLAHVSSFSSQHQIKILIEVRVLHVPHVKKISHHKILFLILYMFILSISSYHASFFNFWDLSFLFSHVHQAFFAIKKNDANCFQDTHTNCLFPLKSFLVLNLRDVWMFYLHIFSQINQTWRGKDFSTSIKGVDSNSSICSILGFMSSLPPTMLSLYNITFLKRSLRGWKNSVKIFNWPCSFMWHHALLGDLIM